MAPELDNGYQITLIVQIAFQQAFQSFAALVVPFDYSFEPFEEILSVDRRHLHMQLLEFSKIYALGHASSTSSTVKDSQV